MVQSFLSLLSATLAGVYALFLLTRVRCGGVADGVQAAGLLLAVFLEIVDLLAWQRPGELPLWRGWGLLAEAALPACWLLFALTFARAGLWQEQPLFPRLLLYLSPLLILLVLGSSADALYYSPDFALERLLFLGQPGFAFSIALFVWLTAALVQLERTLGAQPPHARWQGKFELLGAGVLLTGYLIYYSQGLLHRTVDMNLLPVRSLALGAGAALMAYSRWRRGTTARFQLSREAAFRSVVLLSVGCYLIGLGLLGEGLRYLNPVAQKTALTAAAFLGGLAVIVLFLSETAKRRIRVWLHKNFFREKYDYREQWRRFTLQLAAARSHAELHRAIPHFFAETFAVQGAALFLRDPDGTLFRHAAASGIPDSDQSFSLQSALVRRLNGGDWVFASRDEEPEVRAENGDFLCRWEVSFVIPFACDRALEGFVVLGRPLDPGERHAYEDFDLMKMLAAHAASALRNLRLADQLTRAREMAAIGRVSAFVLHDLKNLASRLAMVADNAREHFHDPEFREEMLQTVAGTVIRMKTLSHRLKSLEEKSALDLRLCDLARVVADGVRLAGGGAVETAGPVSARIDPEEMRKVVQNLVANALEASAGRPVRVEVGTAGRPFFRVCDQGCGMSEAFIRWQLFRPFATTKEEGFGIGLYQCKHIVEAHGGGIEVCSRAGKGSVFTVWLPGVEGAVSAGNTALGC